MGMFKRTVRVLETNYNALLDRAENPQKVVGQIIRDVEKSIGGVTESVGTALANQKRIERQLKDRKNAVGTYQKEAEVAVAKGDDEGAKLALSRQRYNKTQVESLTSLLAESEGSVDTLRAELVTLRHKLEELRLKQNELSIRHETAVSRKKVAQAVSGIGGTPVEGFKRMEDKVIAEEASADAHVELATLGETSEVEDSEEVEADLAALKEEMNKDQ